MIKFEELFAQRVLHESLDFILARNRTGALLVRLRHAASQSYSYSNKQLAVESAICRVYCTSPECEQLLNAVVNQTRL